MYQPRSFYVKINGEIRSKTITLLPNYTAVELGILYNASNASDSFQLWKTNNSTLRPIINAFDHYALVDTEEATFSEDSKSCCN